MAAKVTQHEEELLGICKESALKLYLKEIGKSKPLTLREEADLAIRIRKNDRKAQEKLIKANLHFVVSVARNYQNQGLPLIDLINEGNLGLITASKMYNEKKNFRFISYAVWWIRQAILQALAEKSRIIRLPLNCISTIYKVGKAQIRLEQKYGRMPHIEEIAEELDLRTRDVQEAYQFKTGNRYMSLDAPLQHDEDGKLMDVLRDDVLEPPDEEVMEASLLEEINKALATLTEREKTVINLYYGLEEDATYNLQDIGKRLKIHGERVRQIKEKALSKLRHASRKKYLVHCLG